MQKLKLVLSFGSIGLIYYGSQSLYTFFATPDVHNSKHIAHSAAVAGEMSMIPGACALVAGLVLAFGCIFWWASSLGSRPRRRYNVPPMAPQTPVAPPTGRMLADMSMPAGSMRPIASNARAASGTSVSRPVSPGRTPQVSADGRRVHDIRRDKDKAPEIPVSTGPATPPPFDPY